MKWRTLPGNGCNDGLNKPFVFLRKNPEHFMNVKQSNPLNKNGNMQIAFTRCRLFFNFCFITTEFTCCSLFLFFHISKELIIHKAAGNSA